MMDSKNPKLSQQDDIILTQDAAETKKHFAMRN